MKHRPNVECAVAQVATWRGRRLKLRDRGVTKNHAWLKRRTATLNLRNLTGRGLARQASRRAGGPRQPIPQGHRRSQRARHGQKAAPRRAMDGDRNRPF